MAAPVESAQRPAVPTTAGTRGSTNQGAALPVPPGQVSRTLGEKLGPGGEASMRNHSTRSMSGAMASITSATPRLRERLTILARREVEVYFLRVAT